MDGLFLVSHEQQVIYIYVYITSSLNDECSYSRVQRFRQKFKQTYPSLKLLASPVVCPMFLFVYCKIRIRSDQVYTWPFWKKTFGPINSQLTSNLSISSGIKKTQPENSASPAGEKKTSSSWYNSPRSCSLSKTCQGFIQDNQVRSRFVAS